MFDFILELKLSALAADLLIGGLIFLAICIVSLVYAALYVGYEEIKTWWKNRRK